MKENIGVEEKFDSWTDLVAALESKYTTSLREVCQMLKSSREWVNRYIRAFVSCVYVRSNKRGETKAGIDWLRVASIQLGKPMQDSIWFNTTQLQKYILDSVVSVSKQTKSIPVQMLMEPAKAAEYRQAYDDYERKIKEARSPVVLAELCKQRDGLYKEFVRGDILTTELISSRVSVTKRSEVEAMQVLLPDVSIGEWIAPHDIKEYGDADETIYRNFFRSGYIRIELQLKDMDGCIGSKVYYTEDPDWIRGDGERIIVSEKAWQKYHNAKKGCCRENEE